MTSMSAVNGAIKSGTEREWKVGLINNTQKYLTAETFGFKINVTGTALKKKQIFSLVEDSEELICIRSNLGRYLSGDKYGNVTCEAEEIGQSERFAIEYAKDNSGRWAFRNVLHGLYLGCVNEIPKFASSVSENELWTIQLSIHPMVHMRNVHRKRYVHLGENELQITQVIPWGIKPFLLLEYVDGKYAIKTYDNRYLKMNGELSHTLSEDGRYNLEIRTGENGGLVFQDKSGCYLTGVGSTAIVKGRMKQVGKDELFTLDETHPSVRLLSYFNKKVSIKQGVEVSASQDDEGDTETFQMIFVRSSGKWAFRTMDNKYWKLDALGSLHAIGTEICPEALFDVDWHSNGSVSIKASNGRYVFCKLTGILVALSEESQPTVKEMFFIKIVNRPFLVLRSEYGFVGSKPPGLAKPNEVICNRLTYEVIFLEPKDFGSYFLKSANGNYWSVNQDGSIVADGSGKTEFVLQCLGNSTLAIRSADPNGCYIKGEQNGHFLATSQSIVPNAIWEF